MVVSRTLNDFDLYVGFEFTLKLQETFELIRAEYVLFVWCQLGRLSNFLHLLLCTVERLRLVSVDKIAFKNALSYLTSRSSNLGRSKSVSDQASNNP